MKTNTSPKVLNKHCDIIPPDAIYIGRGSKYGNPFSHINGSKATYIVESREKAIAAYELWLNGVSDIYDFSKLPKPPTTNEIKKELKGKDLWCFCKPLDCHGDILLEIANS